jgi:hypothetical protein
VTHLRWIDRSVTEPAPSAGGSFHYKVRVLQYWDEDNTCDIYIPDNPGGTAGKWVDVPVGAE